MFLCYLTDCRLLDILFINHLRSALRLSGPMHEVCANDLHLSETIMTKTIHHINQYSISFRNIFEKFNNCSEALMNHTIILTQINCTLGYLKCMSIQRCFVQQRAMKSQRNKTRPEPAGRLSTHVPGPGDTKHVE